MSPRYAESLLAYLRSLLTGLIKEDARKVLVLSIHEENTLEILGMDTGDRLKRVSQDLIPSKPAEVSRLRKVGIPGYRYAREDENIA